MTTFDGLELREIMLSQTGASRARENFLARAGLRAEPADYAVGIFDSDDNLVGTAALSGEVMTCVAVDDNLRDTAMANTLVSAILDYAFSRGIMNPKVFTKPEYAPVFRSLGFVCVGEAPGAVLLEHDRRSLPAYLGRIGSERIEGVKCGCIVMNVNPMTLGHLHLIRYAASQVEKLFIIPVADDPSTEFTYDERRRILTDVCASIANVRVLEGSGYAVSRSTFPTYFLKEITSATDTHILLDLDIFARHIAPALGVTVRFVGTEPSDPLTARYNEIMREFLPKHGVEVMEIPRMSKEAKPVSASAVRRLLSEGRLAPCVSLTPAAAWPYMIGRLAVRALRMELDLTPKPGLVDRSDSGAHDDMDYALMYRSTEALRNPFVNIALASFSEVLPTAVDLQPIGMAGEEAMLKATGGVNTHKGALFSLGLAVAAVSHLLASGHAPGRDNLRETIRRIAATFKRAEGTHGAGVASKYGIPTALDYAREGYPEVFEALDIENPHRALLMLMSRIEDSNIYYRCGADAAREVKGRSAAMLENFRVEDLSEMNREFSARRISPGGAADMLALTFFLRSVL